MDFFVFVGDGRGVAEEAAAVAVSEYYFGPVFEVCAFGGAEDAVEVEIAVGPLCG